MSPLRVQGLKIIISPELIVVLAVCVTKNSYFRYSCSYSF